MFASLVAPAAPGRCDDPADSTARAAPATAGSTAGTATLEHRLTLGRLAALGFENLSLDVSGPVPVVAFENRRYRHSVEAVGYLVGENGGPVVAIERRLGLETAAITVDGPADAPRFHVRYPTDRDFPAAPRGPVDGPTSRSVDLLVGPLIAYELGRVTQPVQFQLQIEPRIRYNPWRGARATVSMVIPLYNDFMASVIHPDVDELRPGLVTLEQFLWVPRFALCSATAGLFGDNRYGFSVGGARPFREGRFLLDAQADLTGFIAFNKDGVEYSATKEWSSFLGLTWRPPIYDLAIRGRLARFIYGDQGEELEVKRSIGDVDFALFSLRSGSHHTKGVRISVPVPPMTRGTRSTVRVQPIERFPFSYRTETETIGLFLGGVASREDFLRQLSAPALENNRYRYSRAKGDVLPETTPEAPQWISHTGTTGFINTPWAGTARDRSIELSYSHVPKKWAYSFRGGHANEPWAMTIGLIPRVEASMRFTRVIGKTGFLEDPDNRLTTDTDHMASGRLMILTPRENRPGLAVGVDDVEGTRRFHSSYVVSGLPFRILHVQNRISLGYAPHVFTAARHVLDGGFGAFEVSPWRDVAVRVEYDTEKWNAGIGVGLGFGLRLRAAALNMESVSVGAGWYHKL